MDQIAKVFQIFLVNWAGNCQPNYVLIIREMAKNEKKLEEMKDINQLEKDFQFANYLKQKYELGAISN